MKNAPFIYKIDLNKRLLKDFIEIKSIIIFIIKLYIKKKKGFKPFNEEDLQISKLDSNDLYLYIIKSDEKESDWAQFFPDNLFDKGRLTNQTLNIVLFVFTQQALYAVVGGNAFQMILPFLDESLGIGIYSRILDSSKDDLISLKARGVSGSIASLNNQYKEDFKLIDLYKFGSITNEIHVKLCVETCYKYFKRIMVKPNDRLILHAAKGIKLKKNISFQDLMFLCCKIDEIYNLKESEFLLSYKEIDAHSAYVGELNELLLDRIYNDVSYINEINIYNVLRFQFEFTNPSNTEAFYEADYYKIKEKTEKGYTTFDTVEDKNKIYSSVLKRGFNRFGLNEAFNFKAFLKGARVVCYKNGKRTVASSFLFHFNTEIPYNNESLFLIDTKWYRISNSFIEELNYTCNNLLQSFTPPGNLLYHNWDKSHIKREDEYNDLYLNTMNYLVLDKIIVDGIELCDILYYDASSVYLFHVKYGFTGKVRELTNQIKISASRLKLDLQTDKSYLKKVFELLEKAGRNNYLTADEFVNLFKDKRKEFVLAYTNHRKEDKIIAGDMENYDSNIAKFSIIECNSEMNTYYYHLNYFQIPRLIP